MINILLCILIFILILGLIYFNLFFKYKKLKNDLSVIIKTFRRIRYGDINIKIDNLNDKELETSINKLIETMYDREMMIKEYQSTLSKKNLSLEEILKQEKEMRQIKEDFTATLTHDMKVPVIAELNSLEYLLEGRFGSLNEKQLEVLKLMKASNKELKELIENMLEVYKIEQKEIKLNISNTNINNFLNDILQEMQPIADENNNKIVIISEKTAEKEIPFDSFQLKRVIKNLIQNAISFSSENDEIIVTTDITQDSAIISVSNKGTGISKEDLDLIFHKLYSGQSKFRKSGTGLGLYLSKQIMTAHNGNIDVDTSKQGITTFNISIPLKTD